MEEKTKNKRYIYFKDAFIYEHSFSMQIEQMPHICHSKAVYLYYIIFSKYNLTKNV